MAGAKVKSKKVKNEINIKDDHRICFVGDVVWGLHFGGARGDENS